MVKIGEDVLLADLRALTGNHIGYRRYCWAVNHEYPWNSKQEYRDALVQTALDNTEAPS